MSAAPSPSILPGATLGILGGGQLGAMFAAAARRMGYRVEAISDVADCPAARHSDRLHVGAYHDGEFLARVARARWLTTAFTAGESSPNVRWYSGTMNSGS